MKSERPWPPPPPAQPLPRPGPGRNLDADRRITDARSAIRRTMFWHSVKFAAVVLASLVVGTVTGIAVYRGVLAAVVVRAPAIVVVFAVASGFSAAGGVVREWTAWQKRRHARWLDRMRRGRGT